MERSHVTAAINGLELVTNIGLRLKNQPIFSENFMRFNIWNEVCFLCIYFISFAKSLNFNEFQILPSWCHLFVLNTNELVAFCYFFLYFDAMQWFAERKQHTNCLYLQTMDANIPQNRKERLHEKRRKTFISTNSEFERRFSRNAKISAIRPIEFCHLNSIRFIQLLFLFILFLSHSRYFSSMLYA